MKPRRSNPAEDDPGLPGPFDPGEAEEPWLLQSPEDQTEDSGPSALSLRSERFTLVDVAGWMAAEAALATDLAELNFDLGRLTERARLAGHGAIHRLALEETVALSWWTGDRVGADRLAL